MRHNKDFRILPERCVLDHTHFTRKEPMEAKLITTLAAQ